jgi:hypothetical protein
MAICTNTEVFNFMGTTASVVTSHGTEITNLITRVSKELEQITGRVFESETVTNVMLSDNRNCYIYDKKLFLTKKYRDLYSITTLTETGTSLTLSTDYNDGNDYILDADLGVLEKINENWSLEQNAIKLTGKVGFVNTGDDTVRDDIKQLVIEMVAVKSGLWKRIYNSEEFTQSTLSDGAKDFIKSLTIKGF